MHPSHPISGRLTVAVRQCQRGCVQNIVSVYSTVYSGVLYSQDIGAGPLSDDDLSPPSSSCPGHTVLTAHPPVNSRESSQMMMMIPRPHMI